MAWCWPARRTPRTPRRRSADGKNDRIVGVYLPTAGVNPLWGHRKYDPIFAAAQEADLPVCLHSVTIVSPAFPYQLDQFENHFARQVLSHSFAMMANLTSIMHTGVPARYPKLRVVFTEAGIAWVPYMMWRMDKYYNEYRRHVPFLDRRPSEYMRERMWFATQPIEEPDDLRRSSRRFTRSAASASCSPPTGRITTSIIPRRS